MEVAKPRWLSGCPEKGHFSAKNAFLVDFSGFEKMTVFESTNFQFQISKLFLFSSPLKSITNYGVA